MTLFAAGPILRIVLGKEFTEASAILVILVGSVMFTTVGIPCVAAMTSGHEHGVVLSASLSCAGLALGVASWAALVPALDVDGVAWGYLVGARPDRRRARRMGLAHRTSEAGPYLWRPLPSPSLR